MRAGLEFAPGAAGLAIARRRSGAAFRLAGDLARFLADALAVDGAADDHPLAFRRPIARSAYTSSIVDADVFLTSRNSA